ncbi:MAG: hypothetical protein ACRC6T_08155 [Sarcina sp.]
MENYLDFFDDEIKVSKTFNTSGVCIDGKHYMVNINKKLREIVRLVQHDKYFVINRPRQYGKTTTLSKLEKILSTRYKVLSLDFEGMTSYFKSEETFGNRMRSKIMECVGYEIREIDTLGDLGDVISEITKKEDIVLMIDEVDKISNNKLFEYIYSVLVLGIPKLFNISNPIISLGHIYGYLEKSKDGMVQVSNQILREYIYNYMISRANNNEMSGYNFKSNFVTDDNGLDMKKVLLKFQQFI